MNKKAKLLLQAAEALDPRTFVNCTLKRNDGGGIYLDNPDAELANRLRQRASEIKWPSDSRPE